MTKKRFVGWTVGAVAVTAAFALGAAAFGGTNGWWMPHAGTTGWMPHMGTGGWMGPGAGTMGGGWGLGMALVALLWLLLFVGVPAVLAYWFLAREGGGGGERLRPDVAMDELRARYARGEIDETEFEARRRRLAER